MSMQAGIRREGAEVTWDWESQIFAYASEIFDQIGTAAGLPNLFEFASDEEGPAFDFPDHEIDAAEEALPEDSEEDGRDVLIRGHGPWHESTSVAKVVGSYLDHLRALPRDSGLSTERLRVEVPDLIEDLEQLETVLSAERGRMRIVIG